MNGNSEVNRDRDGRCLGLDLRNGRFRGAVVDAGTRALQVEGNAPAGAKGRVPRMGIYGS